MADYGGELLKNFAPIGCRDEGTLKIFEYFNIPAYLSGCCTLTLEPFANITRHGKIVLTDVSPEIVEFVKARTRKNILLASHTLNQPSIMDWKLRRGLVEDLLKIYQGASLVVTCRLHAALPCLALGTPVLLVTDKLSNYRFSTFVPYLNHSTPEDLLSGKYSFDFDEPKPNPGGHEKFSANIKRTCTEFVRACESEGDESLIDVETWLDGYKRTLRLKRIMQTLIPNAALYKF